VTKKVLQFPTPTSQSQRRSLLNQHLKRKRLERKQPGQYLLVKVSEEAGVEIEYELHTVETLLVVIELLKRDARAYVDHANPMEIEDETED
tara:strand:- start:1197 stop:1469 length:273 start_codon:yes stop_codon:yes gene_type:complete